MLEISGKTQLKDIADLPEESLLVILEALTIIKENYGNDMETNSGYGGIVVVLQSQSDLPNFKALLAKHYINLESVLPEYVNPIICSDGQIYCHSLILVGSDFGIVVLSPIEITPDSLKKHLVYKTWFNPNLE